MSFFQDLKPPTFVWAAAVALVACMFAFFVIGGRIAWQGEKIVGLVSPWSSDKSNAGEWVELLTPSGWDNVDTKCRVQNGWIEFRGRMDHPEISGWPSQDIRILPQQCRPLTRRYTEMPCHAKNPPRNTVCNNDFTPDGSIKIYSDFPVIQQRFEGVRIWQGP